MDHISSEIQATLAPFHTHIGVFFQTLTVGRAVSQRCTRLSRDGWDCNLPLSERAGATALYIACTCVLCKLV